MEKRDDLFPKQHILFQIAAAVGIEDGEPEELEGEAVPLIKTSADAFDPDGVLESLMIEKYPDATEKEQLEELEKYADAGIEIIHDKVKKTGTFDIENYID
jgi:hypothetical protein